MSLIFWQPQEGLVSLSIKMVRLVRSGNLLPRAPPRGRSISPPGPWAANFRCHSYRVCRDRPTSAAKSAAGRPLRRQVSSKSSRCSAVNGGGGSAGLTRRRPRCRPKRRAKPNAVGPSSADGASATAGVDPSTTFSLMGAGVDSGALESSTPAGAGPCCASATSARGGSLEPDHKNSNIRPPFLRMHPQLGRREFRYRIKRLKWQVFQEGGHRTLHSYPSADVRLATHVANSQNPIDWTVSAGHRSCGASVPGGGVGRKIRRAAVGRARDKNDSDRHAGQVEQRAGCVAARDVLEAAERVGGGC